VKRRVASRNTWVSRTKSPILDTINRRAADLLQLDEALLRRRTADEYPDLNTKASIAEDLQLVHYDVSQQYVYTPHHDFSMPNSGAANQPARFATVLFYLNDDMKDGETAFPRWKHAETGDQLKVTPEVGKAILFYSLLPDGNMDELSEHAALPVIEGEKWLINMWAKSLYGYFLCLFAHAIKRLTTLAFILHWLYCSLGSIQTHGIHVMLQKYCSFFLNFNMV
jgi:prolyl 4-hydroxylase